MKKKASKFKQAVVDSSRQQKSKGSQYGYLNLPSGVNIFKEEADTRVLLDFLPYKVTDPHHPDIKFAELNEGLWYRRPFRTHRNVGVANEALICPSTVGKRCPICEYRSKRLKEGADKNETDSMKFSNRNLYCVVPLNQKDYEEKPHLWDISQYLFQNMLNDEINENEDRGVFADLEEGLSLKIRFSETAIGKTKFAETSRIDFEERSGSYDEKILEKVPNLDAILNIMTYDEIEAKFFEIESEQEKEEKEEKEEKAAGKPDKKDNLSEYRHKKEIKDEPKEEKEVERKRKDLGSAEKVPVEKQEDMTRKPPKATNDKCPHGYEFGKDCEQHDECDACNVWSDCYDKKGK